MPFKAIREIAQTIEGSGRATMPLAPASILERRKCLVELLSKAYSAELPRVLGSRGDGFRDSSFVIELGSHTGRSIPSPVKIEFAGASLSIKHDGSNLIVDLDSAERSSRVQPTRVSVSRAYSLFLLGDLFPDPFILSTERFGISLFYRELDFTESQLAGLPQKLGDNEGPRSMTPYRMIDRAASRYALPIKDNIQFTQRIMDMPKDVSALADEKLFDGVKNLIDGYYGNASDAIRFISSARGKGRRVQCTASPRFVVGQRAFRSLFFPSACRKGRPSADHRWAGEPSGHPESGPLRPPPRKVRHGGVTGADFNAQRLSRQGTQQPDNARPRFPR